MSERRQQEPRTPMRATNEAETARVEAAAAEMDETVEGGRYMVGDVEVDAFGVPLKDKKKKDEDA